MIKHKNKLLLLLFIVMSLFFIAQIKVHAAQTISMVDGAQIRTTGEKQGLRFLATAAEEFPEGSEHGYFVAKGEHSIEDLKTAIESGADRIAGNKLVKKVIDGDDLNFNLVIYNIPANAYKQDITAVAYIKVGDVYTFPSLAVTRNIAEVAVAAYPDYEDGEVPEIIAIAATQTVNYTMNGGAFHYENEFSIKKFNTDISGYNIKLSYSTTNQVNMWWYLLYLSPTSNPNVFEIVNYTSAGTELYNGEYSYVIGAHDSCTDKTGLATVMSLMTPSAIGKLISLSSIPVVTGDVSITASVFTSDAFDDVVTRSYVNAEVLKSAVKDYYDFGGWFDNASFTGSAVTTISAGNSGSAINLYAKFTPIQYTLSFDLQGGSCSADTDDIVYTIESDTIYLPDSSTMSKDEHTFVGWNTKPDGTGTQLTSIPKGSHGNITVYAVWEYLLPVEVVLSSEDISIINEINPTKFVSPDFLLGKFLIGENVYYVYDGLFSTVYDALLNAVDGDVIYVFPGVYDESVIVKNNNIKLVGPGANKTLVHTDTYSVDVTKEALMTKELVIQSGVSNTTIRGFSMTNQITISGNDTVNISNIIFGNMTYDSNLDGSIRINGTSSNITIDKMYLTGICANRGIHINALTTNFSLTNSVVLDSATTLYDFVRFGQKNTICAAGAIYIADNYIQKCIQSGIMDRLPSTANYKIIHNVFDDAVAAIYMRANADVGTATYEIKFNTFNKCGSSSNNWDDVAITNGANTIVNFNYNIITYSYDYNSTTDPTYNIKVRSALGVIDCSNNYIDAVSEPTDNLNATGLTLLTSVQEVYDAYEDYLKSLNP